MLIYREGLFERRDFLELRRIHPELLSFQDWLKQIKWRGEARTIKKVLRRNCRSMVGVLKSEQWGISDRHRNRLTCRIGFSFSIALLSIWKFS